MEPRTEAIADLLGRLEQAEARLLSWGMVDGSFGEDELLERAERFIESESLFNEFHTPEELLEELEDRRLIFSYLDGIDVRYRTRMGEAIRLLSRLRQLFPRHMNGRQWQTAPSLVADYRYLLRPRAFPQRATERDEVVEQINAIQPLDDLQVGVLDSLVNHGATEPFRLADFQVRASRSILSNIGAARSTGAIVCAGTGSGKTLAFYLPAFLHLAPTLDESKWTRCIAIYPRNELLKDQLSETFRQARRIDGVLTAAGRRKLQIGALFGSTPESRHYFRADNPPTGWASVGGGFACPYLRCPNADCSGQLVWRDVDRNANVERLQCASCGTATQPDELALTRESLRAAPPDILFTTTEMLNQRMGDSRFCHLFGIGNDPRQKPSLVLLDEVHTYSGVSGAQVALLLRRWRRAARIQPHFVGLSATLADARRFFARLVGVDDYRIDEISPHPNEIDRQGMEYMLAVRGDPASGVSLLSTTIQTAMLMRRVQDPAGAGPSEGLYGTREFVFTDDLDVTNRLFFNLRDAEGEDSWGRRDPQKPDGSLANLRDSARADDDLRFRFGQSWRLCESIGHALTPNTLLTIDRTSSQDIGVTANSDIIVATASLEVGFNDPDVNVVLQHKAPRDVAQFLQRKGRAGRRTEMRPCTVVVLSDYGRDRLAWQSYDLLFDPEIPPRDLPVSNRYVLRMQAVYAFQDWIADQLRRNATVPGGSVWRDFSAPSHELGSSYQHNARRRQLAAASIVEDLLRRDDRHEELHRYLQESLQQGPDVIDALMWEPPRALMTAVLPTLLRRLNTDWQRAVAENNPTEPRFDYFVPNNPLPEFVPGRLFADLNLPEVTVVTPPQQQNDDGRREPLPVLQAMREFAPGRVSRRFGIRNQWARHWIAPPSLNPGPTENLALDSYVSLYDELGQFQYAQDGAIHSIRCVRPFEFRPQRPPGQVLDTSNSFLLWKTQIVPETEGLPVDLPSPSRWEDIICGMEFFSHNHLAPLEIRRFAMSTGATMALLSGQQFETRIDFVEDDGAEPTPVAVGFAITVDGMAIRFRIPTDLQIDATTPNQAKVRALRTSFYRDRVINDGALNGIANPFRRQWLAEIYLSALVYSALTNDRSLAEAWDSAQRNEPSLDFIHVLQVIFQSIPVTTDEHDHDADNDTDAELDELHQRLFHDLSDLLHDQTVVETLHRHAPTLWLPPDETWADWVHAKFKTTLGAAILDAVQQSCPDLDAGDLTLDISAGPRLQGTMPAPDDVDEIWLTERTVGGGGIIENFLVRYGEDPRRFFDLVDAALRPSDFEIADEQLSVFLRWVVDAEDSTVRDHVATLRSVQGQSHDDYASAFDDLVRLLSQRGLFVCHSVVAALGTRVLKPGSNENTDRMLHDLIFEWRQREQELGIDIDSRVFAYLHSRNDTLDQALEDVVGDATEIDRGQWRFGAILSLLWPRGNIIRGHRLSVYNPFASLPTAEHDLVRDCLPSGPQVVDVTQPDWRPQATENLIRDNSVVLRAPAEQVQILRGALISMTAEPVDAGFLLLHPRITGTERRAGGIDVTLELAEGVQ